ncbi:DUF4405 domain-containing protein [Zobellia galactanivorans]|uniref:DUF4405 domain-containing protein n=1 Tax=Zobellia galactanivorans (strain DSM 12802 / CCUG 47099 / CIP 106680 / NCIMB 13871 / Dsij) TaxID=63186 RepID=UPI0026E420D4|nr:DUF4405 domain-containing protein [Zobellia galactanivorans]MDO6808748.1 DUF4405 domain-containing protein [Zobellia galactanivorans]
MNETSKTKKTSKVRVYVDLFFFTLMVLVLIPQTTGIPLHEWASFIIILPFFLHLIINWNWIATNSKKFFQRGSNKTRFDYVLNWTLYFFMIVITVSGIVISEAALPVFGIHFEPDPFWTKIHNLSATLFMPVFGIHIALHWRWILGAFSKFKFKSDLHHLTEVGPIISKRMLQLLLLICLSIVLSLTVYLFEFSEWAEGFRTSAESNSGQEPGGPGMGWMRYVLPLVKVTVLTGVPALIAGGIIRLKRKLRGKGIHS